MQLTECSWQNICIPWGHLWSSARLRSGDRESTPAAVRKKARRACIRFPGTQGGTVYSFHSWCLVTLLLLTSGRLGSLCVCRKRQNRVWWTNVVFSTKGRMICPSDQWWPPITALPALSRRFIPCTEFWLEFWISGTLSLQLLLLSTKRTKARYPTLKLWKMVIDAYMLSYQSSCLSLPQFSKNL